MRTDNLQAADNDAATSNHHAASSAEPFHRPDHKAKKRGRPRKARKSEVIGGGFFVFRRHESGRVAPNRLPFEHGTFESAAREAARLSAQQGEQFAVFAELKLGAEVALDVDNDNWDFDPRHAATRL